MAEKINNEHYGIEDIQSLDFREAVRTRIQMYLGSDDNEGTYQALKEIINNSTDEAIAGYGNIISIEVSEKQNKITVADHGRGVPFGIREDGENVLVSIYSRSHTGGKFNDSVYKNVSGLNGIGAKCVCLSSKTFHVISKRDGKEADAWFEKGILKKYTETKKIEKEYPHGTIVSFEPDPEVFKTGNIGYSYERICQDIKDISFLYPGVTFNVDNFDSKEHREYKSNNGIKDFVKENNPKPLHRSIGYYTAEDDEAKIEVAFQWGDFKGERSYVFVNGLRCVNGGSPITGAKTAITKTFNSLAGTDFSGDSIRNSLCYVINCSVAHPSFANQTKDKINNTNLRTLASNAFSNGLKEFVRVYRDDFYKVVDLMRTITKAEAAAERARRKVMDATKEIERAQKSKTLDSDKLKDSKFLGLNSTLLIAEGDSAMGSIAQARDEKTFGILAVRGKMINCLSNPEEKIFDNEEIKLLLSAMNIIPGKYNASKLRYGRLAICTDADSDGYHIGLLIMAALHYLAPQFINEGRLCWLRSPLYIVKNGKTEKYYFTDQEFNEVRGKIKGEVQRNKGLGSLTATQASESMFNPINQHIDVLKPSKEALTLLENLMNEDVEFRKEYIFKNLDFSEVKE